MASEARISATITVPTKSVPTRKLLIRAALSMRLMKAETIAR